MLKTLRTLPLLALALLAVPSYAQPAEPSAVAAMAPPAPDYNDPTMWAAGPAGPGVTAHLPAGASPAAAHPAVDVFYIYPTVIRSDTAWSQDPRDAKGNLWTDESAIARQASVFSACCRIFAPHYRSATYKALTTPGMRDPAFALAYGDVERAFDWYLAHENHGRPFIIAGHSQGAFHIATLLERRIDGTPLQKRMVAAYIIGINLAQGEFGRRFHSVVPCATPTQTGCVVQWNALLDDGKVDAAADLYEKFYVDRFHTQEGKTTLCVNPLTFAMDKPTAPAAADLGAVPGAPGFGAMAPLRAGAVSAQCRRGMLVVDRAADLGMDPLPGTGVMHYHDYGLFWANIRANAVLRTRRFLRR